MVRKTVMTKTLKSSFYSCEKDAETIIKKLFVESNPYSSILKRLLVVNKKVFLKMKLFMKKLKFVRTMIYKGQGLLH